MIAPAAAVMSLPLPMPTAALPTSRFQRRRPVNSTCNSLPARHQTSSTAVTSAPQTPACIVPTNTCPDIEPLIGLVKRIASWFERKWSLPVGMEHDDLVGIGVVGLLKAVRRFDPTRGCSIETFAGYAIRGAMFRQLGEMWAALNHEAPPVGDEIQGPWPLPERAVLNRELQDAVFARLNVIDQTLVIGRLDEQTFDALGRQLNMPIATVRRQHERALRRLRNSLKARVCVVLEMQPADPIPVFA